jgi:hypothetical protein
MAKRNVKRHAGKTPARKRSAARDLSTRSARKVVGGLLPAVQNARAVSVPTQGTVPMEQWSMNYSKLEF